MMAKFTRCSSTVVPLLSDHIDTDQIIPARFLTCTDKEGLADCLFADWRKDGGFILNRPEHRRSRILLAGENFGCGSSREHAPWALVAWGFRVVIATSFADIFRSNAIKNGLLPVALASADHRAVGAAIASNPSLVIDVDLERCHVAVDDRRFEFSVDSFGRHCLLEGIDQIDYLLGHTPAIERYEAIHDR